MRTLGMTLIAAGLLVAGCAAQQPPVAVPGAFQRGASSEHVELYWTCSQPEAGLLRVDGVARNRGQAQPIRFLELELVGVNDRDRTVSEASTALPAIQLYSNEASPFRMELHSTGAEVRYDLYYRYLASEGNDLSALGFVPVQLLAQQNQRFMVRDACASRQR